MLVGLAALAHLAGGRRHAFDEPVALRARPANKLRRDPARVVLRQAAGSEVFEYLRAVAKAFGLLSEPSHAQTPAYDAWVQSYPRLPTPA